ncbi:MAG TPA: hypothetical protein VLU46_14035 [Thermoanaerobaculia bacterium]|nr:hypothetical protein [Thermoanaerobaculia bacterium]
MPFASVLAAVIVLAGDPVSFAPSHVPQFTDNQIRTTADATRAGLARWAATGEGRKIIEYCVHNELVVHVVEDPDEEGIGRAPDPRLQSLVAAARHTRVHDFDVVLNPQYFRIPQGWTPLPNEPKNAADAMAAAWAGEMLHVYFYARGIGLPHHARADFQDEWREVAAELGMPAMTHDDDLHARRVTRER